MFLIKQLPYADSYWVIPGKIIAGEYPEHQKRKDCKRIQALLKAGVRTFIRSVKTWLFLSSISKLLSRAEEFGLGVTYKKYGGSRPGGTSKSQMIEILDEIDLAVNQDEMPYIHCIAGIGRLERCWGVIGRHAVGKCISCRYR
jgi:hypothetical protein